MGQVYRAADTRLDRAVAIKVMPAALAGDPIRRERFEREARSISRLEHPNICPLYDVGELPADVGGGLFLVMQFLEGETLAAAAVARRAVDQGNARRRHSDRRGAGGGASRRHRASRPEARQRDADARRRAAARLRSRADRVHRRRPTARRWPAPIAPRSPRKARCSARCITWRPNSSTAARWTRAPTSSRSARCCTRWSPASRRSRPRRPARVLSAILRDEPARVSTLVPVTPAGLDELIHTCLAKDPNERWQGMGDVARQLRWLLSGAEQREVRIDGQARVRSRACALVSMVASRGGGDGRPRRRRGADAWHWLDRPRPIRCGCMRLCCRPKAAT